MLFVDLYELTMMQSYFFEGEDKEAVFDFYIRYRENIPRRFYVFCGLEYLLEALEDIRFTKEEIEYLRELKIFKKEFLDYLSDFRFSGDIYSIDEGRIVFPDEPLVEVRAPLSQAQFIETLLINLLQFSILSATKAARCFAACQGKMLVDFGARRAHSHLSAEIAARSAYIAGFSGTSLLSASKKYMIPAYGTMAHSFIMAHKSEKEAFEKFAKLYKKTVLLIDTYNVEEGTKNAIEIIKKLEKDGIKITALRLDSGNHIEEAKKVKKILEENGINDVEIFISGGVNEYEIKEILKNVEGIGGFGVGTEMTVSADQPYLDCAYKLVEYDKVPKMKLSEGKQNIPGRKKVVRIYKNGRIHKDIVALHDENISIEKNESSEVILKNVFSKGKTLDEYELIKDKPKYIRICRERFLRDFERLPEELKELSNPDGNPVVLSSGIKQILQSFSKNYKERSAKLQG